ncbi:MAG: isoaspartyl peptidase/L-asparaginase [Trueperaceae bacterium]|nr:isoaspartyl peptidase/L-asparaginase [Trueperaceae bacterium]
MAIIVLHGGAGSMDTKYDPHYEAGINKAADAGYAVLLRGGSAIDAVIAAVRSMESNPDAFNAGVGGALTNSGEAELDACVMASDGTAGAVTCVRNSRNPVLLADIVRTQTPHVLLAGASAEALERSPIANSELYTPRSLEGLERWRARQVAQGGTGAPGGHGTNTVGAVALADDGTLAAATSTGGVVGQWSGRIGDAPIPGAGTYADARVAISCTGKGEAFLRAVAGKTLATAVEYGVSLQLASEKTLQAVAAADGSGGLIAVTAAGHVAIAFDTEEMSYAIRSPSVTEGRVARDAGVWVVEAS